MAKHAVCNPSTITIVADGQDLLVPQDGHQGLGARVPLPVLVPRSEESLKLEPQFFQHGAVVHRVGKGTAANRPVPESLERNVDRVGQVEGVEIGGAAKVEDLGIRPGGEMLPQLPRAAGRKREHSTVACRGLDDEEVGQGVERASLPRVVVSVEIDVSKSLRFASQFTRGVGRAQSHTDGHVVIYLVLQGAKLFGPEILKVLVQVLVGQVRADEDAVDFAVGAGQLRQTSVLLLLVQTLKQALKGEAGRRPAYDALSGEIQREAVRLFCPNFLQGVDGGPVGELDFIHEGVLPGPRNSFPGIRTDAA